MDENILFDEKSQSVIITTADKVVQMPTESLTYFINQKPVAIGISPLKHKDGEYLIALETVMPFYPLRFQILEGTNAVLIQRDGEEILKGKVINKDVHEEKLRLRTDAGLKSPYTAQTEKNEAVSIEGKIGDYYFVRKENGVAGYLRKNLINDLDTIRVTVDRPVEKPVLPELKGPIHLTWEAVYTKNPDVSAIPEMSGVNVVSPTWFKVINRDGPIQNLASLEYVKWAKNQGYQVWGLFSNNFDPDLTNAVLKDFETRQNMIRQLLYFSQMYELNGYNIDFENVKVEDGPLFTQFIREATPYFHEAGLYVSVDVTFISSSGNWSQFYEREKLSEIADYIVVMAYDEHWANSKVSGSVASLPWVEKNLEKLLKEVPNEKLILGVPLYTRLWKEEMGTDGMITVSSKAMSMDDIKEWLDSRQITAVYNESSGQNYAEYFSEEENVTYKVWLEDEVSLKKRAELTLKYDLAGVASWSRYFASPVACDALQMQNNQTAVKNEPSK